MSARFLSRILTIVLLGTALGLGVHFRAEGRRQGGREAFLAEEGKRWDRVYTRPHHLPVELIVGIFSAAAGLGFYELVAAGCYCVLPKHRSDEESRRR